MSDLDTVSLVDEKGQPRQLFKDASAAWSYADELFSADQRAQGPKRRIILAFENGCAPTPAESVRDNEANLNWRESARAINKSQELYSDYCISSAHPFEIKHKTGRFVDKDHKGTVISGAANQAWKTWKGGDVQLNIAAREMIRYGLGAIIWPSTSKSTFEAVLRDEIAFEDRAPLDVDEHRVVAVKRFWAADTLLGILDQEGSESAGWKKDEIRELLKSHLLRGTSGSIRPNQTWEDMVREWHANASGFTTQQAEIKVYIIVAKSVEKEDSVDLYVVSEEHGTDAGGQKVSNKRYIRELKDAYKRLSNFVMLLPRYRHYRYLTDLRGVGTEVTPTAIVSSRAKNFGLNMFRSIMTTWFVLPDVQSGMRAEARAVSQQGNYGFLPQGVSPAKIEHPDMRQSFAGFVSWLGLEVQAEMAHDALQEDQIEGKAPRPPSERLSSLEQSAIICFLSGVYEEVYRRMHKFAGDPLGKAFREYLELDMFPLSEAAPEELCHVQANRPIGDGSKEGSREIAGALLSTRSQVGSEGAYAISKFFIESWVGEDNVSQFLAPYQELFQPNLHQRAAHAEHNQAVLGQDIYPPVATDDHVQHLQHHFELLTPDMEAWGQNTEDPEFLMRFGRMLELIVPHLQVHAEMLSGDPTMAPVADVYRQQTENLVRIRNSVVARIRDLQEVQARRFAQEQQAAQQALQEAAAAPPPRDRQAMATKQAEHEQDLRHKEEDHLQGLAIRGSTFQQDLQKAVLEMRKEELKLAAEARKNAAKQTEEV